MIAGIPMESVYGSKTGVYSGSMTDDYKSLITKDVEEIPKYSATGVSMNMIANRLSWFFNFTGPSVNLDSACSSSLMALDVACQGLRTRDSSMVCRPKTPCDSDRTLIRQAGAGSWCKPYPGSRGGAFSNEYELLVAEWPLLQF